jgi:FtsP/CotA-like multicopper oxidase with cupredoxin domain
MSFSISRRGFLASAAAFGAAGLLRPDHGFSQTSNNRLTVDRRVIEVNGRPASVFGIRDAKGRPGLVLDPGERFAVALENRTGEQTIVHWHGQTPPPDADGVTDTGYVKPIADGDTVSYDFAPRAGTHWMHSHHGLQEQLLLAAPLVVRGEADAVADRQEVIVLLHDFSFREPDEILSSLAGSTTMAHGGMGMGMSMPGTDHSGMAMPGMGGMVHLNDVEYDAYLANDRTLDDPEVIRTERGGKVLLRLINGASSTAFWIDLGGATGTAVAVDGNPVTPIDGSRFPLAQAQRLDLLIEVPAGGSIPVLAQREGERERTGIVLAAPDATVAKISPRAEVAAAPVDLSLEARLTAASPAILRRPDVVHRVVLGGGMMGYVWSMDGRGWQDRRPVRVGPGQRVVIEMENHSPMMHPMHLHGHHFQVVGINSQPISGAFRDTVAVPPMSRVAIAFDAENPGRWLFHCHNLYHMATGMMTEVVYDDA